MRQIGTLPNESDARRFTAYLLTQGIDSQAEPDAEQWAIWIRDEDHRERAKEELKHFNQNPADDRYQQAERTADTVRRDRWDAVKRLAVQ